METLSLPNSTLTAEAIAKMGVASMEKDGITTLIFPQDKTFSIQNLVQADGSQSIRINSYDRIAASVVPAPQAQPTNSTIAPINSDMHELADIREKGIDLNAMKRDIYSMSRDSRKYPEFSQALIAIGNMDYDEAYNILDTESDKNPQIKNIFAQFRDQLKSRLQALNTYTYGARNSMEKANQ